jgi:hypothetical protein
MTWTGTWGATPRSPDGWRGVGFQNMAPRLGWVDPLPMARRTPPAEAPRRPHPTPPSEALL